MTRLIFLGPPGAGKGTQAKYLAQHLSIPHISTGEILRQAINEGTLLGVKAKSYVDSGLLVPDELVQDLVEQRLQLEDTRNGWILDGFPRKVSQAIFLRALLEKFNVAGEKVINLDASDEVVISRLLARGRRDDTEDVIRQRLSVYRSETQPLIEHYGDRQQLVTVNGDQVPEDVMAELRNAIT